MSLGNALQIGRTGLAASQAAIEIAGNNLANVATDGYHRQRVELTPIGEYEVQRNAFIGRGVQISQIIRQIDLSLENRLRAGVADQSGSQITQNILTQIEGLQNEFTDNDLSSHLSSFFSAWSELANSPDDLAQRSLVTQEGDSLATFIADLRSRLVSLRQQVDEQIDDAVSSVSDLLAQIEQINEQIVATEKGFGGANSLRDQRGLLLADLGRFLDISVTELDSGAVDVFIGSMPIVLGGKAQAIEARAETDDSGERRIDLVLSEDGTVLSPTSGVLGSLLSGRETEVGGAIDALDEFSNTLIYQINRVHSQGQGRSGSASVTGTTSVADAAAVLNSTDAAVPFTIAHGSFQIHTTQISTGQRDTTTIDVDLDGIDPGNDTTLNDLATAIDAVAGIAASVTTDGRLQIEADGPDVELSFSDDTSGALAALGVNTFFTGSAGNDIAVNAVVRDDPSYVAAGQGHVAGDNRNALAIAALADGRLDDLGGVSLTELWNRHVEEQASRLGQVSLQVEADTAVVDSLTAQQQSISGVSTDEEAIDLMAYQRAYQGSARFLSIVDEMMQTLLAVL